MNKSITKTGGKEQNEGSDVFRVHNINSNYMDDICKQKDDIKYINYFF